MLSVPFLVALRLWLRGPCLLFATSALGDLKPVRAQGISGCRFLLPLSFLLLARCPGVSLGWLVDRAFRSLCLILVILACFSVVLFCFPVVWRPPTSGERSLFVSFLPFFPWSLVPCCCCCSARLSCCSFLVALRRVVLFFSCLCAGVAVCFEFLVLWRVCVGGSCSG